MFVVSVRIILICGFGFYSTVLTYSIPDYSENLFTYSIKEDYKLGEILYEYF